MHFRFVLWNHSPLGQRSLEDIIGIMGHQMRALGHGADWLPGSADFIHARDGINVLVEGFTPLAIEDIARAHGLGARFICLATEEPTPKGFNHGTMKEMVLRQEMFPHAAKYFEGILHLVPGCTDWYAQYAPASYAELGWAPTLMYPPATGEPQFEYGFYGSASHRRMRIMRKLAKRTLARDAVRIVSDFVAQAERDRIMRNVKVILQLRKFEEMGLVSSCRCAKALMIGRPVVAEPHLLSKPWDEIVHFSKSIDAFYNDADLIRHMWRNIYAGQVERFKRIMTPEHCVGEPLRHIGVLAKAAA